MSCELPTILILNWRNDSVFSASKFNCHLIDVGCDWIWSNNDSLLFKLKTHVLMDSIKKLGELLKLLTSDAILIWLNLRFRTFNVVARAGKR